MKLPSNVLTCVYCLVLNTGNDPYNENYTLNENKEAKTFLHIKCHVSIFGVTYHITLHQNNVNVNLAES